MTAWFCQHTGCTRVAMTPSALYTPGTVSNEGWRLVKGGWRCPDHAKAEKKE